MPSIIRYSVIGFVLMMTISTISLSASDLQFPNQNFKIKIPDQFVQLKFDYPMIYSGADQHGDTILIEVVNDVSGDLSDEAFVAKVLPITQRVGGPLKRCVTEQINGQTFLVMSAYNKDLGTAVGSFLTCADYRIIGVFYMRHPSYKRAFDQDPDARALINSFKFLRPPQEPKGKDQLREENIRDLVALVVVCVGGYFFFRSAFAKEPGEQQKRTTST